MLNRKAFKFYRSYWDVACQLSEPDKSNFLKALIEYQFTGVEPKLEGMANFAYVSQKHSINAQIEGYLSKVGATLPPTQGATTPPYTQEKEKEKEEVKEKGRIKIFGDSEDKNFLIVQSQIVNSPIYKVHGVQGLNDYLQSQMSVLNYPEHATKFMSRKSGDRFNDMQHLRNAYAKFVEKQYA
jgi:hypothetical protein